jgi:hypothetical protein
LQLCPEWRELGKNAIYNRNDAAPPGLGRRWTVKQEGWAGMGRIIKAILTLAVLGFIGLVGYAYLGDMTPPQTSVTQPVTLNVD